MLLLNSAFPQSVGWHIPNTLYLYYTHVNIYCIYIYIHTYYTYIIYTQHTYIIYVILVENGVSPKLSFIAWLRPPVNHHEPSGFQCLQWLLSELCCLRPALSWQLHLAAANGSPNVFFKTWTMFKPMLGVFVDQFWGCFGDVLGMFWGCFGEYVDGFGGEPMTCSPLLGCWSPKYAQKVPATSSSIMQSP